MAVTESPAVTLDSYLFRTQNTHIIARGRSSLSRRILLDIPVTVECRSVQSPRPRAVVPYSGRMVADPGQRMRTTKL